MLQNLNEMHRLDDNGRPAGGNTYGVGIHITWQNGPLSVDGERHDPNGAFVEGVIAAAIGRMEFYQSTEFSCRDNALALEGGAPLVAASDSRQRVPRRRGHASAVISRSQVGGVRVNLGRLHLLWERKRAPRPFVEHHGCALCWNLYVGAFGVEWLR